MSRPSTADEPHVGNENNQNPPQFADDLTEDHDSNGIFNARSLQSEQPPAMVNSTNGGECSASRMNSAGPKGLKAPPFIGSSASGSNDTTGGGTGPGRGATSAAAAASHDRHHSSGEESPTMAARLRKAKHAIATFGKFVGPGFMVAVAYSMFTASQL